MKKRKYYIIAYFVLTFIVFVPVLHLPVWSMILFYLLTVFVLALFNMSATIAIFGNYFYASGKRELGVKLIEKAINMNTKSPAAYLNYSILLVRDGKGKEALGYLQKAELLKPAIMTMKNIQLTKGSCYWVLGDIDKAIEVLEKMRTDFDYVNSHVLTTLGFMYFLKEDYDKGEEISQLALKENPESGSAWDNIGQIFLKKNDLEQAKDAFQQAIHFKDDLVDSYYYLGIIEETEGDRNKAKEYFEKASTCAITALNTVTREQIDEKLRAYDGN